MTDPHRFAVFFTLFLLLIHPPGLGARPHPIPMSVDFQMMDALIIKHYYTDPDQTAIILNQEEGCLKITLADPRFSRDHVQLALETRLSVRIGKEIFGKCISPVSWEGYLIVHVSPRINPDAWTISFQQRGSEVLTLDREPARITGLVWDLIKGHVHPYLDQIRIDLSFPARQVQSFISPLLTRAGPQDSVSIMESLTPGTIRIDDTRLTVDSTIDIPEKYLTDTAPVPEQELTESEIEAFVFLWEKWDIFLAGIITSLFNQPMLDSEKQVLLDVLLETRYRFVEQIGMKRGGTDFVREQFLSAWRQVHPIFNRHLSDETERSLTGYLAFFSAADALAALDTLGPALGIEINEQGLIRLIRLLRDDDTALLIPSGTRNDRLRDVLGFEPWNHQPASHPAQDGQSRGYHSFFTTMAGFYAAGTAWASDPRSSDRVYPSAAQWVFERSKFDGYLPRIRQMMNDAALGVLEKSKLPEKDKTIYQDMVMAVAWQESCFRQFITDDNNRIAYLKSYNNTSVGIMQINERVWKGIYDVENLRWDIRYNARAGCEILDTYYYRYALRYLKKVENGHNWNQDQLAGCIYAMYNGGPGQFFKYIDRYNNNSFFKSDQLFNNKLGWVRDRDWEKLKICLL